MVERLIPRSNNLIDQKKMKPLIIVFMAIMLGISAKATEIANTGQISSEASTYNSPQVCQFSLTSYTGTIDKWGDTGYFKVGLTCPQESDVRATVIVFINNEHAASKVVTIKAGKDYSESVKISVGKSFEGQRYKLVVQ